MPQAVRIHEFGGPEVLSWEAVDRPEPGPGEVLLRQTAVGLNFIDTYHRTGLYPIDRPFILGEEGAGIVEKLGEGVETLTLGDRVAYPHALGAYAQYRTIAANRVVRLPDGIGDETAAGAMLKGCTAEYLIRRTYPVKAGDWVLFHAGAGGVGQIALQWLSHIGAKVITTVGTGAKGEKAAALGADHVINYRSEDFAARVRDITSGRGADVVFDGVGAATFEGSLASLKTRGMLVSFGNASGPVPAIAPLVLAASGSLYLTRPTLMDYYRTDADFAEGTRALFDVLTSSAVKIEIGQRYPLRDVAKAHEDLEARRTTGSTVLLPFGSEAA